MAVIEFGVHHGGRREWALRRVRERTGLRGWIMDSLVRLGPVTRQPGGACCVGSGAWVSVSNASGKRSASRSVTSRDPAAAEWRF